MLYKILLEKYSSCRNNINEKGQKQILYFKFEAISL